MDQNRQLKCSLCGAAAPTNAEGEYLPHLQVPLECGKEDCERLLIRFTNPRIRCRRCKVQAVLAGMAICVMDMDKEDYDILRACRSAIRDLERADAKDRLLKCASCGKRRRLVFPSGFWMLILGQGLDGAPFTFRYQVHPRICRKCGVALDAALRCLLGKVHERMDL